MQLCNVVLSQPQADDMVDVAAVLSCCTQQKGEAPGSAA